METTIRSILRCPRSPRLPTTHPQLSLTTLGQTLPQPPAAPPLLLTPVAPAPMAAAMERAGTMVATMAARLTVLPARAAVALGARAQTDWARLGRSGKVEILAAQGEARGIFLVKVARGRPRGAARVTRAPRARVHRRVAIQVQVWRQAIGETQGATPSQVAYRVARTLPGRSLAFWLRPPRWRAHL